MFGLKLFRRNEPARRPAPVPAAPVAPQWTAPAPRASGPPPPPPPPEAFLSAQAPAIPLSAIPAAQVTAPPSSESPFQQSPFEQPAFEQSAFEQPLTAEPSKQFAGEQSPFVNPDKADTTDVDAPAPARVRFFYTDGTVSEPDPQEAERLGYLATNLLEASRDDVE